MKALIQKELRENVTLAAIGFVVLSALLFQVYRNCNELLRPLAEGGTDVQIAFLQPLTTQQILVSCFGFCATFAALLGWFQSHRERRLDLWSFLAHRPLTRTQLFLGKAVAGLGLYLVVAAVPLAGFILWAALPGHVAAPFEWAMLLPLAALYLAGPVYYFAGMLTGLRQARWYASRGLALGAAGLASIATIGFTEFSQVLLVLVCIGAILATATWGSFQSNGFYHGQPRAGRLALTGAMTLGAVVVSIAAMGLLSTFLPRWGADGGSWSNYLMAKDGTVYKATYTSNRPAKIVDLAGQPLLDPKTGRPFEPEMVSRMFVRDFSIGVNFGERPARQRHFLQLDHFSFFRATPGTLWLYWPRYGRLVAYDARTRRPTGSLGPNGFAADLCGGGARFSYPPGWAPSGRTAKTMNAIYTVDLENRTAKLLFAAPEGQTLGALVEFTPHDDDWKCIVTATRHSVYLLKSDGGVVWVAPYQPSYPDYDQLSVSMLAETNQFALWIRPDYQAEQQAPDKHPAHLAWVDGQRIVKTADLPSLVSPREGSGMREPVQDRILAGLAAPAMLAALPALTDEAWPEKIPWAMLWSSLAVAAFICVPAGWWLARRYSLSVGAQAGWAAFHLVTGVPGLLTFFCVREWPARERCPQCGKQRVVDRENCEHCGAAWAPPERLGIELFEPAR